MKRDIAVVACVGLVAFGLGYYFGFLAEARIYHVSLDDLFRTRPDLLEKLSKATAGVIARAEEAQ